MDVFDRSVTEKELVSQSKVMCREYIHDRLLQNGLGWCKDELHLGGLPASNAEVAELSEVLLCLGDELESMRPSLYRNVARQLNISVAMESMVSDAFVAVATDIFSTGITWGKIVSMYAVAGALAVDCVREGQPATVYIVVDTLGRFVRTFLVSWLQRHGGWGEMTKFVVFKKEFVPQPHWLSSRLSSMSSRLSSTMESFKYFLTTVYVCVMKEQ